MNYITFDKDRYHLQNDMSAWCVKHFGEGQWITGPYPEEWEGLPNWTIHCMFGRTTFAFKKQRDYAWFILEWAS